MAAVNATNTAVIYSTFAAGVPINITEKNGGEICFEWDGLDENYMPVIPGTYAAKGIAMPSAVWPVDSKPHAIVAEFAAAALPFSPTPAEVAANPTKFYFHVIGDPVGSSMGAVTVDSASSTAVFYHEYLENAENNFVVNLTADIGWEQCTRRFDSGGAAGGNATTTDGAAVWSYTSNGGSVVYRPDQQPWGSCSSAYRHNVHCPQGVLAGLSSARNTRLNTSKHGFTTVVMVATQKAAWIPGSADQVAFLDGYDPTARLLAKVALPKVMAIDVRGGWLYALTSSRSVSKLKLDNGLPSPTATWVHLFDIAPDDVPHPRHMAVGTAGKAVYISDDQSNLVAKLDGVSGKRLLSLGGDQSVPVPEPVSGTYNPTRLMGPTSVAVWASPSGEEAPRGGSHGGDGDGDGDHVLVLESRGPARIGEWSASGKLVREWTTPQSKANDGYAIDPRAPSELYIVQSGGSPFKQWSAGAGYLVRFQVNWTSGKFVPDAVFPNISAKIGPQADASHNGGNPTVLRQNGDVFVAFQSGPSLYKFRDGPAGPGTVLLPSAGLVKDEVCVPNGNPTHGGKTCVTGHDCSNSGACSQQRKCECKTGYRGDHCQYLTHFVKFSSISLYLFCSGTLPDRSSSARGENIDLPSTPRGVIS
jgi:hypothetical protein